MLDLCFHGFDRNNDGVVGLEGSRLSPNNWILIRYFEIDVSKISVFFVISIGEILKFRYLIYLYMAFTHISCLFPNFFVNF
jgi:hypothetical protein